MASAVHASLDAASVERKARLAKLASLKRKQPASENPNDTVQSTAIEVQSPTSKTDVYLSGRNYDVVTRGPKLGFENTPSTEVTTLEQQAEAISTAAAEKATRDEVEAEKGIDLFKLRPKKPNWDLKRDLAEKMKSVDVRTQNAIARLVRERIENSKKEALKKGNSRRSGEGEEQGEEVGIDGATLVEGVHLREQEEEEEKRREEELDEEDGIS